MNRPPVRRCAIYTRKSSEEGLEQEFNSLEAQREAGVAYVRSQVGEGWRLVEARYDDGGISGGTLERPAVKRLLADIEAGRVHVVVVYKVDRLTRSLADFAKLVEVFERKGVSFVSVTQQFNTTTSMGRLMLNVLLSFAQFEREVTGERIRDKIAASKKKGMWMGGTPPIGYEAKARRLVVVEHDAKTVRHIFRRYLDVGCITLLARNLAGEGIRTRRYTSAAGREYGGCAFSRGHLHRILTNRMYLGEIVHHGSIYEGEHAAIVDRDLWDKVQARIGANRIGHRRASDAAPAGLLAGKVFDDAGNPMTATRMRRRSRQYRYYVSRAVLEQRRERAGSVPRVPAAALEECIAAAVGGAIGDDNTVSCATGEKGSSQAGDGQIGRLVLVQRVVVRPQFLKVELRRGSASSELALTVPFDARRIRGRAQVVPPSNGVAIQAAANAALVKSVVRGNEWARMLLSGEARSVGDLARRAGVTPSYISRMVRYAFLAPDIVDAVLQGLPEISLDALGHSGELPLDWNRQRQLVGL